MGTAYKTTIICSKIPRNQTYCSIEWVDVNKERKYFVCRSDTTWRVNTLRFHSCSAARTRDGAWCQTSWPLILSWHRAPPRRWVRLQHHVSTSRVFVPVTQNTFTLSQRGGTKGVNVNQHTTCCTVGRNAESTRWRRRWRPWSGTRTPCGAGGSAWRGSDQRYTPPPGTSAS